MESSSIVVHGCSFRFKSQMFYMAWLRCECSVHSLSCRLHSLRVLNSQCKCPTSHLVGGIISIWKILNILTWGPPLTSTCTTTRKSFWKTALLCCMLQFSYRIWVSVHHLYKFHLISSSISFFGMIRLILACKFWGVWLFAGQTCSQQIIGKRFKGVQRQIFAVTCHFR